MVGCPPCAGSVAAPGTSAVSQAKGCGMALQLALSVQAGACHDVSTSMRVSAECFQFAFTDVLPHSEQLIVDLTRTGNTYSNG